jgi:glycosyltransferase involved in cell wall biosynthesis
MQDGPEPDVSIIVPVYNEARRLPPSLRTMIAYFGGVRYTHEVIIVVEQSTDGTLDIARAATEGNPNFRVIDNQVHRGKGYAVKSGMLAARGAIRLFMDADLSVPLEEIDAFLRHFRDNPGHDVLLGNRQHPSSRIDRRQGWFRQKMGQTFNCVMRCFAPLQIRDTQCGFKAFRQRAAEEVFALQTIDGFAFDVEILLLARALGYTLHDLPVRWLNSPESKVRIVNDSLQMLRDTFPIKRRVDQAVRRYRASRNLQGAAVR